MKRPGPEVLDIHRTYLPEGSDALTAAQVKLGDGTLTIIELVSYDGTAYEFRGLPPHLGNNGDMDIVIKEDLKDTTGSGLTPSQRQQRQERIMFEFAIGARQQLWPGAEVNYKNETVDPESQFYKPLS